MTITFPAVIVPTATGPMVNGKLTACQLAPVYFAGIGHLSLYPAAARSFSMLIMSCFGETGLTLSATGTYRSYAQQEAVFRARLLPQFDETRCYPINDPRHRTWNGARWYLRFGQIPVATPGKSTHGLGLAVDLAWHVGAGKPLANVSNSAKGWQWLVDNCGPFGLGWEGARPGQPGWEPHHVRHVLGDNVSQRVLDGEAFVAAHS